MIMHHLGGYVIKYTAWIDIQIITQFAFRIEDVCQIIKYFYKW